MCPASQPFMLGALLRMEEHSQIVGHRERAASLFLVVPGQVRTSPASKST
jgi:hypothetical protein